MELLYIWIEEYRNIKEQKFLFTNELKISFDKNSLNLSIQYSEKESVNLFDDTFLNINAIIGQNRSGKTNLLSFIKSIFINNNIDSHRYIVVLKDVSSSNIFVLNKYNIETINNNIIENNRFDLNNNSIVFFETSKSFIQTNISLVNFTNSFSIYERFEPNPQFIDISFMYLLEQNSMRSNNLLLENYDSLKKLYDSKKIKLENFNFSKDNLIRSLTAKRHIQHYELVYNVNFITKYNKTKEIDFIPDYLNISFNHFFVKNRKDDLINNGLKESIDKIIEYIFNDIDSFENNLIKENFKNKIILYLFIYIAFTENSYSPKNEELVDAVNKIDTTKKIDDIIKIVNQYFKDADSVFPNHPIKKIGNIISILNELLDEKNYISHFSYTYTFYIDETLSKFLEDIFNIWESVDFVFDFDWGSLSAGESALLSIFSRINNVSSDIHNDTIWLLIDEGDMYLHPEWQRTFLSDLHKYLPLFFKNKTIFNRTPRKIQLFLTSHSPFLVSDLPQSNIILLDKNKTTGLCDVIMNNNNNTFGANIYDLYSDSFYLKNGFIGEFAKNKIDELFDFFTNEAYDGELTDEEVKKQINIIGEPFVKSSLLQLFDKRFNTNEEKDFIEEEIKRLEERKKQL